MLRQLGYYKSSVDGLWGPGSQAALQKFKMMKKSAEHVNLGSGNSKPDKATY